MCEASTLKDRTIGRARKTWNDVITLGLKSMTSLGLRQLKQGRRKAVDKDCVQEDVKFQIESVHLVVNK